MTMPNNVLEPSRVGAFNFAFTVQVFLFRVAQLGLDPVTPQRYGRQTCSRAGDSSRRAGSR